MLRCQHYVRYEGAMTVIGIEVVGLMLLLRYVLHFLPVILLSSFFRCFKNQRFV